MKLSIGFFVLLACCAPAWAAPPETDVVGRIDLPALDELSGLAASRRHPGVYWAHNDSFGPSTLYALKENGEVIAQVAVKSAPNVDWEDLASFEMNGRAWLAIADIGNNLALDEALHIYVVPEPALGDTEVEVHHDYRFRFAGGPRDAEALAVDVAGRRFLIADKGRQPAGLYALPMREGVTQRAERLADIPHVWPETQSLAQPLRISWRATPTAMDLSADGRRLLLLTYRHVMAFERRPREDWSSALQRRPRWARFPDHRGYEAACWSADGRRALIGHEGVQPWLFGWRPR